MVGCEVIEASPIERASLDIGQGSSVAKVSAWAGSTVLEPQMFPQRAVACHAR
jgi:hypothetical protein